MSGQLEAQARRHGVHISEPRAVAGLPALASNRLLASFQPETLSDAQRHDWLQRLLAAGRERRQLLRSALAARGGNGAEPVDSSLPAADECAVSMADTSGFTDRDWAAFSAAVAIEDEYLTSRRVLGLYPLTALPVKLGVTALQRDIKATFAEPLEQLPVEGALERYVFRAGGAPADAQARGTGGAFALAADSLGLRLYGSNRAVLDAAFAAHAPLLEIDTRGSYDRPGQPIVDASGVPGVRTGDPLAYRYASLVPFAGSLRLQLNYVFWFDRRPSRGPLDTLAGALDSLVWRVTLDEDGAVLLYDSIHSCGCYQQFFPSRRLALRPGVESWLEPPLIPQRAPRPAAGERLLLRVSSGAHYLQRVYAQSQSSADASIPAQAYELRPYGELYQPPADADPGAVPVDLPASEAGGHSAGLFDRHGLVPGTQRAERFYLWPMGIRSPGGMRERGRQPTAFLGRRHFDDADLLDRIFRLQP